jgi:hypothetical protein
MIFPFKERGVPHVLPSECPGFAGLDLGVAKLDTKIWDFWVNKWGLTMHIYIIYNIIIIHIIYTRKDIFIPKKDRQVNSD